LANRGSKKQASGFHVMSPKFNLREVAKQCALLEDHLFHPAKRCSDCIRKHFLTIEALLEEAVTLDEEGQFIESLQEGAGLIRRLQALWIDGRAEEEIAQFVRKFRKTVVPDVFDFRVAATCPHMKIAKPVKAMYTGVFLDDPNQLINWWKQNVGPLHPKVKAHHMTIKFKPSEDEVKALSIGSPTSLKVVGYAQDDKGQAVLVKPQGVRSTNRHPHITVAVDGVSPAYSNDLLKKGITKVSGPTLKGRVGFFSNKQKDVFDVAGSIYDPTGKVASRFLESSTHRKSIVLMKFLSEAAARMGSDVGKHVYVVGGAVRNFVIDRPIKDIDVVIDAVSLGKGRDSEWFAKKLERAITAMTNVTTNQYGVAILTVKGSWVLDGEDLQGEVIEIANARKESYGGASGKGYKPDQVEKATIQEDVSRREFTFNTLMWSLAELANGPDKAQIIDMTGCGLKDLQEGVMKCPSNPDKTFSDDPTRMLRAIKFMVKYGFKIHPLVASSIKRNAKKIRNAPQNAIATLLIDTILGESSYKKALVEMQKLGLLDPIADMIREDRSFRSTMENWVSNKKVLFLFDLLDVGLPLKARTGFLSASQQQRLRQVSLALPEGEPEHLLDCLRQPGLAIKDKDFMKGLARARDLKGKAIGMFMQQVQELARELLLEDPSNAKNPSGFKRALEQAIRRKKLGSSRRELHLFDFDGTLFKSPHKPSWWSQRDWWSNQQSLSPPCVPLKPDGSWWNGSVVSAAKRSIGNSDVLAICCTGRIDGKFRWIVPALLKSAGLNFDEVYLNSGGGTSTYKKKVIAKLHSKHNFTSVHVWEDQHMSEYQSMVERWGLEFVAHPISEVSRSVDCVEEDIEKLASIQRVLRLATKSHAENEDEAIQGLVRRLPKKKPPRNDLRKERVDLKDDEDVEALGQEGDKDLSRNFKRVGWMVSSVVNRHHAFAKTRKTAVLSLLAGEPAVAEGEEEDEGSGGKSHADGWWKKFLHEVKNEKVKNPESGRDVEVPSLQNGAKGGKAQALLHKLFEEWEEKKKKEEGSDPKDKGDKGDKEDDPKGKGDSEGPKVTGEELRGMTDDDLREKLGDAITEGDDETYEQLADELLKRQDAAKPKGEEPADEESADTEGDPGSGQAHRPFDPRVVKLPEDKSDEERYTDELVEKLNKQYFDQRDSDGNLSEEAQQDMAREYRKDIAEKKEEVKKEEAADAEAEKKEEARATFDEKKQGLMGITKELDDFLGGQDEASLFDPDNASGTPEDVTKWTTSVFESIKGLDEKARKKIYESVDELGLQAHQAQPDEKKQTPFQAKLKGVSQALTIASVVNGDKEPHGGSPPAQAVALIKHMAKVPGGVDFLSKPAEEWHHAENRMLVHKAMNRMMGDDLVNALGGSGSTAGNIAESAALADQGDPDADPPIPSRPELAAAMRQLAIDYGLDQATIVPALKKEQADRKEEGSSDPSDSWDKIESDPKFDVDAITAAYEEGGQKAAEAEITEQRRQDYEDMTETDSGQFPGGPATANAQAFVDSGDPADLSKKTDPPLVSPLSAA